MCEVIDKQPGAEYHLNLETRLNEETPWAEAGHVTSTEQIELQAVPTLLVPQTRLIAQLEVVETEQCLSVVSDDVAFEFDSANGYLVSCKVHGVEKLTQPIQDNFYRAPIDNDIGTSEANKLDPNSWFARWQTAGLANLTRECHSFDYYEAEGGVDITCVAIYSNDQTPIISSAWRYHIDSEGQLTIDVDVAFAKGLPPMPRVGLELGLDHQPQEDTQVEWFGRGPHENYPDRIESAHFGRYQQPLSSMHTDYIFPSENGLRCDNRELKVGSLTVKGKFHFSVSEFSQHSLANAKHTNELEKDGCLYVRIDGYHMGVGGDDSWTPSVHKAYQLREQRYRYEVALRFNA